MATIRNNWCEVAGGKETLWYEYDDVLGTLTNVGATSSDNKKFSFLVKENDGKYVAYEPSGTGEKSETIPILKRPLIEKTIDSGKERIEGVDLIA